MNRILVIGTFFLLIVSLFSCSTNKVNIDNTEVNAYSKKEYKKSVKAYSGTLNKTEYDELIKVLEVELKTKIPANKSVLINYNQKAPYCTSYRLSEEDNKQVTNNRLKISSRMGTNYNALDFFVYTKDSFNEEIYEQITKFKLDSGFFYENVFTEHQNCAGFLIIKPNGKFYKHYGGDYYSEVKAFFEQT